MSKEANRGSMNGVMSKGYGTIPKLVMQHEDLSIEAKAIYAYLASFAGAGDTAYPSVSIMCKHLGISRDRFYKHRKALLDNDFIRVTQHQNKGGWSNNIYTVVSIPSPQNKDTQNKDTQNKDTQNKDTQNKDTQNKDTQNKDTQNKDTNNNSSINNSINNNSTKEKIEKENLDNLINSYTQKNSSTKQYKVFEKIWSMYPEKKGKGQVSKKSKEQIEKLGIEKMEKALRRYIDDVEKQRKQGFSSLRYKNGSTWFNSGYEDYLVEESNIAEIKKEPAKIVYVNRGYL